MSEWIDAEAQTPSSEEAVLVEHGDAVHRARFIERTVSGYVWETVAGPRMILTSRRWRPLEDE